jgi:hypothetical protein
LLSFETGLKVDVIVAEYILRYINDQAFAMVATNPGPMFFMLRLHPKYFRWLVENESKVAS